MHYASHMHDTTAARTYLMDRQRDEGITSREMARRLGMSESRWCHVRAGRDRLSAGCVLRACALYPELRDLLFGAEARAS